VGEINDSQQAAWRKTLDVFDGASQSVTQLALFPDDRPVPPDAPNALQVRLSEMRLLRLRKFGDCWLRCRLWQRLELDRFWQQRFEPARGEVPWEKVLRLLAVHRLIDPGSEYRLHRRWFLGSAMDELLHVDFQVLPGLAGTDLTTTAVLLYLDVCQERRDRQEAAVVYGSDYRRLGRMGRLPDRDGSTV
jgi:hypothetical protein